MIDGVWWLFLVDSDHTVRSSRVVVRGVAGRGEGEGGSGSGGSQQDSRLWLSERVSVVVVVGRDIDRGGERNTEIEGDREVGWRWWSWPRRV